MNDGSGTVAPGALIEAGGGEWSCATGDVNADGDLNMSGIDEADDLLLFANR